MGLAKSIIYSFWVFAALFLGGSYLSGLVMASFYPEGAANDTISIFLSMGMVYIFGLSLLLSPTIFMLKKQKALRHISLGVVFALATTVLLRALGFAPAEVILGYILPIPMIAIGVAAMVLALYFIVNDRLAVRPLANLMGLSRKIYASDVGRVFLGWAGYMLLFIPIQLLVSHFVPGFNPEQVQDVGFSKDGDGYEILIIGIMLCLVAPVVEELVFRGYLYGHLRHYMPWWGVAIITSGLFGLAHGQWNVALDAGLMGFVACFLREKTGAIWAGIGLHMLKNFIAFTVLFIFKLG